MLTYIPISELRLMTVNVTVTATVTVAVAECTGPTRYSTVGYLI